MIYSWYAEMLARLVNASSATQCDSTDTVGHCRESMTGSRPRHAIQVPASSKVDPPSLQMRFEFLSRPLHFHDPPAQPSLTTFCPFPPNRKGTARHLLPRETPFQRRFSVHRSIATQSCECFVPVVHDRSSQSLNTPKRLTGAPSYIIALYTLYTACLRAVHSLFPGGVEFWFGIFGLTPPVDYSDRPHGIIFSAVADCSPSPSLCLFLFFLGRLSICLLSVYFLLFSRHQSISSPRHTPSSQGHRRSS